MTQITTHSGHSSDNGHSGGILLLGGGGHCLSVIEALDAAGGCENAAIIDLSGKIGTCVLGVPVIGADEDVERLRREYAAAFVSLGGVGDWTRRVRLYLLAARYDYTFPRVTHPSAEISRYAKLGEGVFAGMGAAVNAASEVGSMAILNTNCVVEHECIVGAYAHIAPAAVLCGGVRVGVGSHIGAGSVVRQGISVGANAIVGAGSVVTRDVPDDVVAFGNPCRVIRKRKTSSDTVL